MTSESIPRSITYRHDAKEKNPILCVFLGKFFGDLNVQMRMRRAANQSAQFIFPGDDVTLLKNFAIWHDVEDDGYGNLGTLTDIYTAADVAKTRGWKAVVILDELSWRQHTGTVQNLEDPTLTAVLVNLECAPCAAVQSPESTFYIRRLPLEMALGEAMLPQPMKARDWESSAFTGEEVSPWFLMHVGHYLYNPFKPVFGNQSHDRDARLEQKVLELNPPLPEEIKMQISSLTKEFKDTPLRELIDTRYHGDNHYVIQCLVPMSEKQLERARKLIQTKLIGMDDFALRRWKKNKPANRRDVSRILDFLDEDGKPQIAFLLSPPGKDEALDLAALDRMAVSKKPMIPALRRDSIESLKPWWAKQGTKHPRYSQLDQDIEFCLDPRRAFPPNNPPWFKELPLVNVNEMNYSRTDSILGRDSVIVFGLTKALPTEVKDNIMAQLPEVHEFTWIFVPWEHDIDGSMEDMLRLTKMVSYGNRAYRNSTEYCVFLDRQSVEDETVVVADPHYVYDDGNDWGSYGSSGIDYGRMSPGVVESWVIQLQTANLSFYDMDYEGGQQFFLDPDYSGPEDEEMREFRTGLGSEGSS